NGSATKSMLKSGPTITVRPILSTTQVRPLKLQMSPQGPSETSGIVIQPSSPDRNMHGSRDSLNVTMRGCSSPGHVAAATSE
ncbi:hypothetical protein A2U01_0060915, partial [Trifolium medium]|nr:hypothetical protein [Trifolium medium]